MSYEVTLKHYAEQLTGKYEQGLISEDRFFYLYSTLTRWNGEYMRKVSTLEIKLYEKRN